jgi:hypothetical protein
MLASVGDTDPDAYRQRLEGRAEVLEAAQLRYRELLRALQGSWWLPRQVEVRRQLELLQAHLAETQEGPALEDVLASALRRAQAEQWPEEVPIVRCMHEVRALHEELVQLLVSRLKHEEAPLSRLLSELEERLRIAPSDVSSDWDSRMAELLPDTLPELLEAGDFGQFLSSLFPGPLEPGIGLDLLGDTQLRDLGWRWPRGEAALAALWERLESMDRRGEWVAELRRRALQPPVTPSTGDERLVHAEFWRGQVRSRLVARGRSHVSTSEPTEAECLSAGLWLGADKNNPQV